MDSHIYLYTVEGFKINKRIRLQDNVTHMDFSEDNTTMQFNTDEFEMLYYSAETGKPVTGSLKDTLWESWTCPLGWPVSGITSYSSGGTAVETVDRSVDQKAIATGDKAGEVKLFKYPCPMAESSCLAYRGHSASVSNVRFSHDGNYLISVGAVDKCIFQWKYSHDKEGEAAGENIKVLKDFTVDSLPSTKAPIEEVTVGEENIRKKKAQEEIDLSKPKNFAVPADAVLSLRGTHIGRIAGREHTDPVCARVPGGGYTEQPQVDQERVHLVSHGRAGHRAPSCDQRSDLLCPARKGHCQHCNPSECMRWCDNVVYVGNDSGNGGDGGGK